MKEQEILNGDLNGILNGRSYWGPQEEEAALPPGLQLWEMSSDPGSRKLRRTHLPRN